MMHAPLTSITVIFTCIFGLSLANKVHLKKLGCWKDTSNRAVLPLEGKHGLTGNYWTRPDALQACAKVVKSLGYSVFAVQNGGWCASAEDACSTYKKYGKSTACKNDGEGGPWANEVYEIDLSRVEIKDLGCWKDTNIRAIPTLEGQYGLTGAYTARADAIQACAKVAQFLGHTVFAVQNGGWCASSSTAYQTYKKYGASTTCKADGEGGPWGNQVYQIVTPKVQFKNLGCWKDTGARAIPTLEGQHGLVGQYQNRANALQKCADVAKMLGYKVFAVQHGGWCASSAAACSTYDKYGPSTTCKNDGEGGPWGNQVYQIEDTKVNVKSLGCWKDTSNRAIPTLEGTYGLLGPYQCRADAIQACAKVARLKGHSIFALQHGGWCASSANACETYKKYGASTACKSDGEGGPWANHVYQIVA